MLILLDIDGVMVPAASWKPAELLADGFAAFGNKAVANLQHIIANTGASIILTTSHKKSYTLPEWQSIFKARHIIAPIEKLPDNTGNLGRKDEIVNWLTNHPQEDYVIIDDDKSLNDLPAGLKARLVLTTPMVGLTEHDANKAIAILHNAALQRAS